MDQKDPRILMDLISSNDELNLFLQHWPAISKMVGQQRAYNIFQILIKDGILRVFGYMNDQQVVSQFQGIEHQQISAQKQKEKKIQKVIKSYDNNSKMDQEIKSISQKKNDKNQFTNRKDKSKQKYQTSNQLENERFQNQLLRFLHEYQQYCNLGKKDITNIISTVRRYLGSSQLLEPNQIKTQASSFSREQFSSSLDVSFQYLQIVDSALYYSSGRRHRLRATQIIAILLFLFYKCKRILLQILTGEGKSTTISCIAAILTISGKIVDIVTTSPLLAQRDVDEKKQFYALMGILVTHNFEDNQKGPKQCYDGRKIVYGTPHSFQVDILFDEYKKKQTRCKRPYEVLIVDEVDSMFVDQKDHQTLLATTYPGFSELIYPMKIIWNRISTSPLYKENNKIMMAIPYGQSTATGPAKQAMNQVIKQIRENFKNQIIPHWRMDFINESLEKWVESAVSAAVYYKEKQHYVIKNGTIVPIDYKNTGCLQQKVHWENGLHQFLQIKHGLQVSTQGMTSNFISNLGHFDKYEYIYGLTGTLGSNQSKKFLQKTYKVDLMMEVPPFKERRLQVQEGSVLYDQTQWAKYIVERINIMILCERSVLVICESIQQVDLLKLALKNINSRRIQTLQNGEQDISDQIDCQEVILATNLAGRGTDLKITDQLNNRGGLHVIIGFMPTNLRVEMQGRGRAARNGCQGSSELAVNYERFCLSLGLKRQAKVIFQNSIMKRVSILQMIRDQIETKGVEKDLKKVNELRCKDRIFQLYCKGVNQIPDFQKNNAKQLAIEQKWAMFLKKVENAKINYDLIEDEARVFIKNQLVNKSQSHYNPNHQVSRGINQLCEGNNGKAIHHFRIAQKETGSLPRIIGGLYQNVCQINENPENSDNIKKCLTGLQKIKEIQIKKRIELTNGLNACDITNRKGVNFYQQEQRNKQIDFINKINNNDLYFEQIKPFDHQLPFKKDNGAIQKVDLDSIKIDTGEARILNGLSNHIDQIKSKYQNLGEGEYITIDFQPITKLLQNVDGDKQQNQEALDKLRGEGLQLLPIPTIIKKKKKKANFWQRMCVFVLGVIQIIVGSVILASTCGALTGFGVTMMMEGAKYCYDSIFRPQLLTDLKAYIGETALKYTFSLAMSGIQGIKQLATLTRSGFQMMNNMPLSQFLTTTFSKVGQGMLKFPNALFSLEGGKSLLSQGLSHMLSNQLNKNKNNNNINQMIRNPVKQIQKNAPQLKKKIEKVSKDQQKKTIQLEKISQRFQRQLSKIIKNLLIQLDQNILKELKNLPITSQNLYILISNSIKEKLALPKGESKEAKAILALFSQKIDDPRLAEYFAKHLNLERLVIKSLEAIKDSKNYQKWKESNIKNIIATSVRSVIQKWKSKIQSKKTQLENTLGYLQHQKDKNNLSVGQFNKKVQKFNLDQKQHNSTVQKFNQLVSNVPDIQKIYKSLQQKKGINNQGQIRPQVVNTLTQHQLIKEALRNVQYKNSVKTFNESMENAIYNQVVNYGLRIINQIKNSTDGIAEQIEKIAKQMRQ